MRRQQREQEEIFASYMSHRSLTPRLHKELKMSNTLKPNISSEERNEETVHKEFFSEVQTANEQVKKIVSILCHQRH